MLAIACENTFMKDKMNKSLKRQANENKPL